jgi:hypothetical protein
LIKARLNDGSCSILAKVNDSGEKVSPSLFKCRGVAECRNRTGEIGSDEGTCFVMVGGDQERNLVKIAFLESSVPVMRNVLSIDTRLDRFNKVEFTLRMVHIGNKGNGLVEG